MATSRIKTSSVLQGFPKSRSLLAGNAAFSPDNFESIATVIVGSGGSSTVTFSSIPQSYAHLQIRYIDTTSIVNQNLIFRFNSDTGNNYAWHRLLGTGSAVSADATGPSTNYIGIGRSGYDSTSFAAGIFDLLDYTDTNKYKTARSLYGTDANGAGFIFLGSGLWLSTSAVSTITIESVNGNFAQYSKFALYGIRD